MTDDKKTTLRGIICDPYTRTVEEVFTEPYPAWKSLIEVDMIEAVTIARYADGSCETLWIDEEGLLHEKADGPYIKVRTHPQPMAGKGIVLGTDQKGDTISSRLPVDLVKEMISFPDNIRFVGFKELEPRTVDVPGFGPMMQIGSRAVFEPVDANPKRDEEEFDA